MLEELKSTDVECLRKIACRLQIKLILLSKFFSKSVWFISPESGFNHVSTNVSISRENEKTKFCNQVLLVSSDVVLTTKYVKLLSVHKLSKERSYFPSRNAN